jgi:hypothetical protein
MILAVHPVLTGDTLCTSRTLYYKIGERSNSAGHLILGRPYWHPESIPQQFIDRIKIIYDVTDDIKVRRALLKRQREYAAYLLLKTLYESWSFRSTLTPFFRMFPRILNIKEISGSPQFWMHLLWKPIKNLIFRSILKK